MAINLSKEQVHELLKTGFNAIPIFSEFLADLETPVSLYLKLKVQNPKSKSFLLESVEGGEKLGKYSFIGLNPAAEMKVQNNICEFKPFWTEIKKLNIKLENNLNSLEALNQFIQNFKSPNDILPFAPPGLVGALAYDIVKYIEPVPKLKVCQDSPESIFFLLGDLIVFDNLNKNLKLITNIYFPKDSTDEQVNELYNLALERIDNLTNLLKAELPSESRKIINNQILENKTEDKINNWSSSLSQAEFENIVLKAQEHIKAGDIFQIVLSQQLKLKVENKNLDSLHLYRLLRNLNPSPCLFLLDFADFQLIGSSPEVMVKCFGEEKNALLRPIAGTYRRGKNDQEDLDLMEKLKKDPKELAEHLMLIDLARNDLGRVAKPSSVQLTDLMIVEKYSHVLHLVSEITCQVKSEFNVIDLLKAVFPAGTLSGSPKVKAMQIISELEPVARGFYGGCVGYIGFNNYINTAMTIRTILLKDNEITLQVGAGIVYDSEPSKEYQETINKAAALLKVIEQLLA